MGAPVLLWDFDGTLVDSGSLWRAGEYAFLAAHGLAWNDAASRRLVGGSFELMSRVVAEETGTTFPVAVLEEAFIRHLGESFSRAVPWMPGVRRLLRAQHAAGIRAAVVTSSPRALVDAALATLDDASFEVIVSRDDVSVHKPDPAPYRLALQRLAVAGSQAIAIEDSLPGVSSALAAGCHVVKVGEHDPRRPASDVAVTCWRTLEDVELDSLLSLAR